MLEGVAFRQEEVLGKKTVRIFLPHRHTAQLPWIRTELYILHPNNVVRCGHSANESYAVASGRRGLHIGTPLVLDCLAQATGFKLLQFEPGGCDKYAYTAFI